MRAVSFTGNGDFPSGAKTWPKRYLRVSRRRQAPPRRAVSKSIRPSKQPHPRPYGANDRRHNSEQWKVIPDWRAAVVAAGKQKNRVVPDGPNESGNDSCHGNAVSLGKLRYKKSPITPIVAVKMK